MASKPNILCILKAGMAVAAAPFFRDTWNWVTAWCANLKAGDGLVWENRTSDHPTLKVQIVAGDGISVSTANGAIRISAVKEVEDEGDGDEDEGNGTRTSGGGNGGDGGNTSDAGGDSALGVGDSGTGGGSSDGGSGGEGEGGGESADLSGSSCNTWSGGDESNGGSDAGMSNDGDSCSELNGW